MNTEGGNKKERKKERQKERKKERQKERKKDTRRHSFFKHMLGGGEGCICNEVLFLKINVPHWDVFAYE